MKIDKPKPYYVTVKYFHWTGGDNSEFPIEDLAKYPNWYTEEYDIKGLNTYSLFSDGSWSKYEYDLRGNIIYVEDSSCYWEKWEYGTDGNEIYNESSDGMIYDNR